MSELNVMPTNKPVEDNEIKTLNKMDVIKSWIRWFMFAQSNYNYERMQATSFAHSMLPIVKKLYKSKEDRKSAVQRHLAFFNTEPICGSVIHGITIAMEEEKSNGKPISDEGFNAIKTGLMGPLAGVGDTLTQGIITPILLAICIGITNTGNVAGPIIFLISQFAIMGGISFSLWMSGYNLGKKAVEQILQGGKINKVIETASVLGTLVMGGLVGRFVDLKTNISFNMGEVDFSLQTDLLDKLMPGLIPFALTLIVLQMVKKGVSPIKIMGILIGAGAILGALGIF
ncbi:PTS system mannose/fructose/sorbose family transporter subunit IID [Clostridium botulinum]|uniref:PTS system mannose/fructose/sorbose family IID component n=1 Tax=Clostridium botulinum (strain Eklund 17B / Type B) TaxID=935198 RepID=B2TQX7_CLOBB|nr:MULTISPECIES: PTS system mannose/fructose/sorbose family transporter subunit IID [Clostridium]ACD24407.1 PTS system mannose/fructose/sorbose family IID component [Clostridium botulinum B str. Eklund 17B (NRP)]AIY79071.1 PTS system mannose/fructose/sorbose IID component family protein [Clostridium botulinum 202F]KAI3347402.1 PTS system mannose/fructose/sorbose family transporter subunit IID [Clostridium botulinum]MBN1039934.1 PTS system mannose/fructose/sorbose family transporter subunit IID 